MEASKANQLFEMWNRLFYSEPIHSVWMNEETAINYGLLELTPLDEKYY